MSIIGGIFSLLIIAIDIYAIYIELKSMSPPLHKILWIIVILALPIIGVALWYFITKPKLS